MTTTSPVREETIVDHSTADPAVAERSVRLVGTICGLLPRVLRRQMPEITRDTTLMEDLAMSSTSGLELLLELEEELEIEISVEDLDRTHFATVGTLADYVAANILPSA
ncbi:MAG TPA: phosphopantetheine-binding protein [Actinoplanes sp.]|nr:phosphopantetheine-binding protein [Actinoplanes sp.]